MAIFPVRHESNSLGINMGYLRRVVAIKMEFGTNVGSLNHPDLAKVDLAIENGLRAFYFPMILPGERYAHTWSFLNPRLRLHLVEDQDTYDLPPGFAMLDGPMVYPPGTSTIYPPVTEISEHQIMAMAQYDHGNGLPRHVAIRIKTNDPTGTRFEAVLYPKPDGERDLLYRATMNPDLLKSDEDVPLGGQFHAQTIIESCLTAADELLGNQPTHAPKFLSFMAASISHDRKVASPETLGLGKEYSDRPIDYFGDYHDCDNNIVTYNGEIVT